MFQWKYLINHLSTSIMIQFKVKGCFTVICLKALARTRLRRRLSKPLKIWSKELGKRDNHNSRPLVKCKMYPSSLARTLITIKQRKNLDPRCLNLKLIHKSIDKPGMTFRRMWISIKKMKKCPNSMEIVFQDLKDNRCNRIIAHVCPTNQPR